MAQGIADCRANFPTCGGVTERALGWAALGTHHFACLLLWGHFFPSLFKTDGQVLPSAQKDVDVDEDVDGCDVHFIPEVQQTQHDCPRWELWLLLVMMKGEMSPSSLAYALLTVQTKAAGPKQPGSWSKIAKKFENFLRREEGKNRSFFFPQNEVRLSDTDFFFPCHILWTSHCTEKMLH